jgi:hypothetical protein
MNDKPDHRQRDWKKIHHSPYFWLGLVLFLAGITIYAFPEISRGDRMSID